MDCRQQRHRHAEAQQPAASGEHGHVHVIEHEHLIAQHGEPVEVIGTLVMGDGHQGCLQTGDVRFERDRDLVTEAPLHPGADRAEKPRCRGRNAETERRRAHQTLLVHQQTLTQQLEPEGQQRVRKHRQLRQDERGQHQPGLVAVTQLAQAPHRGERRRQVVA